MFVEIFKKIRFQIAFHYEEKILVISLYICFTHCCYPNLLWQISVSINIFSFIDSSNVDILNYHHQDILAGILFLIRIGTFPYFFILLGKSEWSRFRCLFFYYFSIRVSLHEIITLSCITRVGEWTWVDVYLMFIFKNQKIIRLFIEKKKFTFNKTRALWIFFPQLISENSVLRSCKKLRTVINYK